MMRRFVATQVCRRRTLDSLSISWVYQFVNSFNDFYKKIIVFVKMIISQICKLVNRKFEKIIDFS